MLNAECAIFRIPISEFRLPLSQFQFLLSTKERFMSEPKLKLGDAAPDFKLRGVITKPDVKRVDVQLSDYRGSKNVVIAFHPFAFTAT
jgi:hypothetical protein